MQSIPTAADQDITLLKYLPVSNSGHATDTHSKLHYQYLNSITVCMCCMTVVVVEAVTLNDNSSRVHDDLC